MSVPSAAAIGRRVTDRHDQPAFVARRDLGQGGQVADDEGQAHGHRLVGLERGREPRRAVFGPGDDEGIEQGVVGADLVVRHLAGEHDRVGDAGVAGLCLELRAERAVADEQADDLAALPRPVGRWRWMSRSWPSRKWSMLDTYPKTHRSPQAVAGDEGRIRAASGANASGSMPLGTTLIRSAGTPRATSSSRIARPSVVTPSTARRMRSSWARRRTVSSAVAAVAAMSAWAVQLASRKPRTSYTSGRRRWSRRASPASASS